MRDEEQLNPGHREVRTILRVVGPLLIGVGAIFMAIGLISFFSAFGSFEPPRYFWCCFIGAPLIAIGSGLTKVAYMGAMFRYFAGEVAPVQKDTFNYLAKGVSPGVTELTQAVREGWQGNSRDPGLDPSDAVKYCSNCGQGAAATANFCSSCGQKLA